MSVSLIGPVSRLWKSYTSRDLLCAEPVVGKAAGHTQWCRVLMLYLEIGPATVVSSANSGGGVHM